MLWSIKRLSGFYSRELLSTSVTREQEGIREATSDTLQPCKARSLRALWGFCLILRASRVSVLKVEEGFVGHGASMSFAFQIPYIETSAKDPPLNVDKAFHDLVRVIR